MPSDDKPPVHALHFWEFQVVRDALALGGLAAVVWLGARLSVVSVPLLVALALAYLCEPLVSRLAAILPRFGRTGAVTLLLLAVAALLGGALMVALPPLARQATALAGNADTYATQARAFVVDAERPAWFRDAAGALLARLGPQGAGTPAEAGRDPLAAPAAAVPLDEERVRQLVRAELDRQSTAAPDLLGQVTHAGSSLLGMLGSLFGAIAGAGLFLTILVAAFLTFAIHFPGVAVSLATLVPGPHRARASELLGRMDRIISGFVRGRLITAAVLGAVYAIGWTICGVPYALVLGLATGALSLVPYLAVVGLPMAWILLAMASLAADGPGFYTIAGASGRLDLVWWKLLLFPALVNTVAQSLEDYVLNPLIQGKATDLPPLAIMIAIIAGGSLAGLYGMILAVPAAACARVLASEVVVPRIRAWAERAATPGR